jgi:hypothetical protein
VTPQPTSPAGRHDLNHRRRITPLTVLLAVGTGITATLLATGCGSPRTFAVASIPDGTNATSRSPATTSTPTKLLDEWTACMRSHGDPNQADPTIDTYGAIHIAIAPNGNDRSFFSGFKQACQTYLHDAITALRVGKPFGQPDTAKLLTFSNCMRAHGIPDFPDPSRTGLVLNGAGDLNPNNPTFRDASKTCTNKTGVQAFGGTPQPGALIVKP